MTKLLNSRGVFSCAKSYAQIDNTKIPSSIHVNGCGIAPIPII